MEMPKVKICNVTDCAYNIENACHTPAITIGNEATPRCDTFCHSAMHGGDASCCATVGACKVASCTHNSALECQATEISVGYKENEPMCTTFKAR